MLFSFKFARFAVAFTLASSVLGAAIPITTAISSAATAGTSEALKPYVASSESTGALWKNNVHEKIYSSATSAATPTAEGGHTTILRRSGELWNGMVHEEVNPPSRRSGELWRGLEHEEVTRTGPVLPRRSGELWRGLEHEEVSASNV